VATTVDGTSVAISFEAPAFDGGSTITGYQVMTDDGDWVAATTTGTSPLVVTVNGQASGSHVYAVRAGNAVGGGASVSSDVVEVVVVATPTFHHGWSSFMGDYWVYWSIGNLDASRVTGWELSVNGGPWLPVSVSGSGDGDFSGTAIDPGCASTGGHCHINTTGRIRAVTTTGYSAPSNSSWIYWD
jgi:hypothetical protein